MANKTGVLVGTVVLIVVIGLIALYASRPSGGSTVSTTLPNYGSTSAYTTVSSSSATSVPVAITDPPQVPEGTSALVVSYSSVEVQTSGEANSGWVKAAGSGSINLQSTINTSTVIGYANLTANSTINMIRLNVTSASITVNGTTYNVSVPSGTFTAHFVGRSRINSSSAVLIDVNPVVYAVYSNSSNTTAFVMLPAARAVLALRANASARLMIGDRLGLDAEIMAQLRSETPNIAITSANVTSSGNTTKVSVTVKDNSNQSVILNDLIIYGRSNARAEESMNSSTSTTGGYGIGSGVLGTTSNLALRSKIAIEIKARLLDFRASTFFITPSGGLVLASESNLQSGITLSPGASQTIMFTGVVSYGDGEVNSTFSPGTQYRVVVAGSDGAVASATVTAG